MDKLLVNADDFGYSKAVNDAIVYGFERGLLDRTSLMVNMPYCEDAINKAKENGFDNKVALHLNVVEGEPLTTPIKETVLCSENGLFDDDVMKKTRYRLWLDLKTKRALKIEIEEQIRRYLQFGIGQKHLDSHRHSHVAPSIFFIVLRMTKKYGFNSIRLARNIPTNNIRGTKKLLKTLINKKIVRFNYQNVDSMASNIEKFGSIKDICNEISSGYSLENTELMIHPIFKETKFCDAIEKIELEEWLTTIK